MTTSNDATPAPADSADATGTTTIRIATPTKARLKFLAESDESIGDVVTRLTLAVPMNTETSRGRDRIAAYLRSYLVPDFGDHDETGPGEALWADLTALQHREQDPVAPIAVVLDNTALSVLVDQRPDVAPIRRLIAQLLYTQPHHPHQRSRHLFAPTQAIHTANMQHPGAGLLNHITQLDVIEECSFDLAACRSADRLPSMAAAGTHVIHAGWPSKQWPAGRPVLTTVPPMYEHFQVVTHALTGNR